MKYLIEDSDKNKYEAYTKEEVIALLQAIIESGELPSGELEGVVLTIKNPVDNQAYKIAFCTEAQYNTMQQAGTLEANCMYYITDDTSYDDLVNLVNTFDDRITSNSTDIDNIENNIDDIENNIDDIESGKQIVGSALLSESAKKVKVKTLVLSTLREESITSVQINKFGLYAVSVNFKGNSQAGYSDKQAIISVGRKDEKNTTSPYWSWRTGPLVDIAVTGDSYVRFQVTWNEDSSTGTISLLSEGYNSNSTLKIVECRLICEYDLYSINAPTYRTEYEYTDEEEDDYYGMYVTNHNSSSGTLYHKTQAQSNYSSVSINAYQTIKLGTYIEGLSGTMYLVLNGETSEIVNWSV